MPASDSWAGIWAKRSSRRVTVDTTQARQCKKCTASDKPVYRHHKGFDSYVGLWNKRILFSYYLWLNCVPLCEDCHCAIHYLYEPYLTKWKNRTPKGAKTFREKLIAICDEWLLGKRPSPRVPKEYREAFHQSLLDWQKGRGKRATG